MPGLSACRSRLNVALVVPGECCRHLTPQMGRRLGEENRLHLGEGVETFEAALASHAGLFESAIGHREVDHSAVLREIAGADAAVRQTRPGCGSWEQP